MVWKITYLLLEYEKPVTSEWSPWDFSINNRIIITYYIFLWLFYYFFLLWPSELFTNHYSLITKTKSIKVDKYNNKRNIILSVINYVHVAYGQTYNTYILHWGKNGNLYNNWQTASFGSADSYVMGAVNSV